MGYRSDVRIMISKKGYNELKKYTDNYLFEKNWGYGNLLNNFDIRTVNSDSVYLGWNDIKWYSGYSDVDFIIDFFEELRTNGHPYSFVRIGEGREDIEVENYYGEDDDEDYSCDVFSIVTEIDMNM